MLPFPRQLLALSIIIVMLIFSSRCLQSGPASTDPRGGLYAGAATCLNCHKAAVGGWVHTTHAHSTSPMADSTGPFHFKYAPAEQVSVEKGKDGFYQVHSLNGKTQGSYRMDIAFGSHGNAQTFGYWQGDTLFELPLSWYNFIGGYAGSPGFPHDAPYFKRPIVSRCFECHSSYISGQTIAAGGLNTREVLDRGSVVYGIDCERCHGPGAAHAEFQASHPDMKTPRYMTIYRSLSRQQQMDLCAVCHSGNDQLTQRSTFAFRPGDTLSHYYYSQALITQSAPAPDVHGKQVQLLKSSKCYMMDQSLTCITCHDVHDSSRKTLAAFATTCMQCHKDNTHYPLLQSRCIDCHMPQQPSHVIDYLVSGQSGTSPYMLRTHRIAVYPEQTRQVLATPH